MKTTKDQKLVKIQVKIDAPVELIWKLWNNPGDIVNWCYGSEDWHTPKAIVDLREGGKFSTRMEAKNGSEGFDFEGTYQKIIPNEKIEYTIADGRRVTVAFLRSNGGTKIVETFEPENLNPVEMQHDGWQFILDNFKRYAEIRAAFSKSSKITHTLTPCLWFDHQAEEAANFYVSVFRDSKILGKTYYTKEGYDIHHMKEGTVLTVEFKINGQTFTALNGGPLFKFNEAISYQIFCDTQDEIDYYWSRLTDGGEEGQCGWLKDRYGLSWQVTPTILPKLLSDPAKADRVMKVFMPMKKLIIDQIKKA